jgi:hypothetical protein
VGRAHFEGLLAHRQRSSASCELMGLTITHCGKTMHEPSESENADGKKPAALHAGTEDFPNDPFPTTRVNDTPCVDRNLRANEGLKPRQLFGGLEAKSHKGFSSLRLDS